MSGIPSAAQRLILLGLAAGAATAALAADDLGTPPFPNSLQREVVTKWIASSTTLPKAAPQVFGVDSVVAILGNETKPGDRNIRQVTFREEALQANYVTLIGGRSITGSADVDCKARAIKLSGLTIYAGSNLQGRDVSTLGPRTDWRVPTPDRVLARVVSGACASGARTVIAEAARPAPAPTRPPEMKPAIEAPRAAATPAPPPAPPVRPAAPVEAAAAPSRPAAPPPAKVATAPPKPPAPRPPPPRPVAPAPAPPPAATPPAAPSTPPAAVQAGILVQVGAVSSQAAAGQEWDRLAKAFPEAFKGRTRQVVKIEANGKELYRVLIGGFSSKAAAQSFCGTLQGGGRACFIRN